MAACEKPALIFGCAPPATHMGQRRRVGGAARFLGVLPYDDMLAVLNLRKGRHRSQRAVGAAALLTAAHRTVDLAPEGVLSSHAQDGQPRAR